MNKTASVPAKRDAGALEDRLPALLESSRDRIAAVLPKGVSPERFAKIALVAYASNPDLVKCTGRSVLTCVMQAAELGLELGKPLDLAHLVPFGDTCQLILDYKGFLALARRTGEFALIDARLVHERDKFSYVYTPSLIVHHEPCLDADRGALTHAYAYAKLANGEEVIEVMAVAEIEAIRGLSRSGNSPAWRNHFGEMARKVALKRLLKRQARTVDLARAAEIDDQEYADQPRGVRVSPAAAVARAVGQSRSAALAARLAAPTPAPHVAEAVTDGGDADAPEFAGEAVTREREPGED